jgi:hypothetical protein
LPTVGRLAIELLEKVYSLLIAAEESDVYISRQAPEFGEDRPNS